MEASPLPLLQQLRDMALSHQEIQTKVSSTKHLTVHKHIMCLMHSHVFDAFMTLIRCGKVYLWYRMLQ